MFCVHSVWISFCSYHTVSNWKWRSKSFASIQLWIVWNLWTIYQKGFYCTLWKMPDDINWYLEFMRWQNVSIFRSHNWNIEYISGNFLGFQLQWELFMTRENAINTTHLWQSEFQIYCWLSSFTAFYIYNGRIYVPY